MSYKIVFNNGKEKITDESLFEIANKYSGLSLIKKVTKEDRLIEYARALKENCNNMGEYCEGCVFNDEHSLCPLAVVPMDWEV